MIDALKVGCSYFALVFATGFALGAVRTLWVAPQLGARAAELVEMPIMLLVMVVAARWLVRRHRRVDSPATWLAAGLIGLALMLLAEFGLVGWLRGLSLAEYVATRDPVSGAAYGAVLCVFALLPLLLSRRGSRRVRSALPGAPRR
jgi:hypothetical protein